MAYNIEPMPMISFLDENKLELPRFQRKATWNLKQNFELCISVFQEYPVGVVIVNRQNNVSWLLDGRQRRSALKQMHENPVAIYDWAQKYLGFGKAEDSIIITKLFWEKVDKYLESEVEEEKKDESNASYEGDEEEVEMSEIDSFSKDAQKKGLQTLLEIILMVHQKKPKGSAWELLFDYRDFFKKLKYAPLKDGDRRIDPSQLRKFLLEMSYELKKNNDLLDVERFVDFYLQSYDISDENIPKFKKYVEQHWAKIKESIEIIEKSESIYSKARIGVIWLTNASSLDAQNIFSRINSGGTQLKAEELLSAKPFWNIKVETKSQELDLLVKEMYKKLDIPNPECSVRWDVAATLISRIDHNNLVFDSYNSFKEKNEVSMDQISLGFKMLSSIKTEGMSANHVLRLENDDSEDWDNDIEQLIVELNNVFKILMNIDLFKVLQSWKMSISKLLGNAIALEFITICYLNWKDRGCPNFMSGELKAFQRDAKILFDRLVFEYATKVWRGSGDSKMANDIKNWKLRVHSINHREWLDLIDESCNGVYKGTITSDKTLKPILYYYYSLSNIIPVNQSDVQFDLDHIIPKEKFVDNKMVKQQYQNCLSNFALLPKKDNISKKSKYLNEITDPWLKSMIKIYAGIDESDFEKFSDISNIENLVNSRKETFIKVFDEVRISKLSN